MNARRTFVEVSAGLRGKQPAFTLANEGVLIALSFLVFSCNKWFPFWIYRKQMKRWVRLWITFICDRTSYLKDRILEEKEGN